MNLMRSSAILFWPFISRHGNFILFSGVLFDQFVFDCNFFGFISSGGLGIIEDRLIVKLKD